MRTFSCLRNQRSKRKTKSLQEKLKDWQKKLKILIIIVICPKRKLSKFLSTSQWTSLRSRLQPKWSKNSQVFKHPLFSQSFQLPLIQNRLFQVLNHNRLILKSHNKNHIKPLQNQIQQFHKSQNLLKMSSQLSLLSLVSQLKLYTSHQLKPIQLQWNHQITRIYRAQGTPEVQAMGKPPNLPKSIPLSWLLSQAQSHKNLFKHKLNKRTWDNRDKIKSKNQSLKVQNIKMFKKSQRPRSQRAMQLQ